MTALLEPFARAALAALWAGVVDAAVLCGIVWLVVLLLRPAAKTRHGLWWVALAASAVIPMASFASSLAHVVYTVPAAAPSAIHGTYTTAFRSIDTAGDVRPSVAIAPLAHVVSLEPSTPLTQAVTLPEAARPPVISRPFVVALLALWFTVASILSARLLGDALALGRVKRRARPLEAAVRDAMRLLRDASKNGRRATVCVSDDVDVPAAAGLGSAAILLPSRVVVSESAADLDRIALHEYAHLARYDDVTNLAERILSAALWFNPAVAYVISRIALEREIACDDWVVEKTGGARSYASCLLRLAESTRTTNRHATALGALRSPHQVATRIERLLGKRSRISALGARMLTVAVAILALSLGVASTMQAPAIAIESATKAVTQTRTIELRVTEHTLPKPSHGKTLMRRETTRIDVVNGVRHEQRIVEIIEAPKHLPLEPALPAMPPLPPMPPLHATRLPHEKRTIILRSPEHGAPQTLPALPRLPAVAHDAAPAPPAPPAPVAPVAPQATAVAPAVAPPAVTPPVVASPGIAPPAPVAPRVLLPAPEERAVPGIDPLPQPAPAASAHAAVQWNAMHWNTAVWNAAVHVTPQVWKISANDPVAAVFKSDVRDKSVVSWVASSTKHPASIVVDGGDVAIDTDDRHVIVTTDADADEQNDSRDGAVDAASNDVSRAAQEYARAISARAANGHNADLDRRVSEAAARLREAEQRLTDATCRRANATVSDRDASHVDVERAMREARAELARARVQIREATREAMRANAGEIHAAMESARREMERQRNEMQRQRAEMDRARAELERAGDAAGNPTP